MISRKLFTDSARGAFIATGLDANARVRFEALAIWEIQQGVTRGESRILEFGSVSLEFTFGQTHDSWQVTDVRLLRKETPKAEAAEAPVPEEKDGSDSDCPAIV